MEIKIVPDVYVSNELNKNPDDVKELIAEYIYEQRRMCARMWFVNKVLSCIGYVGTIALIFLISSLFVYKNEPIAGLFACWCAYDVYSILCLTEVQQSVRALFAQEQSNGKITRGRFLFIIAILEAILFFLLWKTAVQACTASTVYQAWFYALYPCVVLTAAAITFAREQRADTFAIILQSLLKLSVEDFHIHEADDVELMNIDQNIVRHVDEDP